VQKSTGARRAAIGDDSGEMLNWDDLRYLLALADTGSLARAARALEVDHTTVGRRIEALEASLGVRLFTRTTLGYALTQEGEALMPQFRQVEAAVLAVERGASARGGLEGVVRVTSMPTLGVRYLAPRLATFRREHPDLSVELIAGSSVLDLARREAEIAVRFVRSTHDHLLVRRAGQHAYALYASEAYLARRPAPSGPGELASHDILSPELRSGAVDAQWIRRIAPGARIAFTSNLTICVLEAALAGGGIAVLPCYLGDAEPTLRRLPMPDEPRQSLWIAVHRDLAQTRRVRTVLDFLHAELRRDQTMLLGRAGGGCMTTAPCETSSEPA
jgi:DNA-binding transcriptional LysR family regulator